MVTNRGKSVTAIEGLYGKRERHEVPLAPEIFHTRRWTQPLAYALLSPEEVVLPLR